MRFGIFLVACLFIFIISCSKNDDKVVLTKEQMMETILAHHTLHLQSETERKLLKDNHIKSACCVKVDFVNGKIDSTTYKEFDREGRLRIWTTSECHTMGCTPFITRHDIYYDGDKMSRMGDFTFNRRFNSIRDCWMADTSSLTLFDWEHYSYSGDSIIVKCGSKVSKYVKDAKGKLVFDEWFIKSKDKIINGKRDLFYKHTNNQTTATVSFDNLEAAPCEEYKYKDGNTVVVDYKYDPGKKLTLEYKFNSSGLLSEMIGYEAGKLKSKTKISYSYF